MDLDNLRTLYQMLSLAGTAAWLAVGGLCLHLWRRERRGWYGRLAVGFLLLGLNRPLASILSWSLEPLYTYFAAENDPFGQGTAFVEGIAQSGLALVAIIMLSLGVAVSARRNAATGRAGPRGADRPGARDTGPGGGRRKKGA